MIVIIGAGVSGLSLSYYLSSIGIKNIVIDFEKKVWKVKRTTGLVSGKIFNFLKFLNREKIIVDTYDTANFWYQFNHYLKIKSFKKMYLINYSNLEKEILNNIDKHYTNFFFGEKVLEVDFDHNFLKTNKRKIKFDILVDASGPYAFLANKLNLFIDKKIFSSFEVFCKINKKRNEFSNINIFFDRKYSKQKFGWFIKVRDKALIGLIDYRLKIEIFEKFIKNFSIERKIYTYSHPILYAELKKYVYKNSLIIGEAAGLVKPFSLGGITYGIISSYLAFKSIKLNNINLYEKKIKKIFFKPKIIGKIVNRFIRYGIIAKILKFYLPYKIISRSDPDFIYIS